jgi:hypothetical protein
VSACVLWTIGHFLCELFAAYLLLSYMFLLKWRNICYWAIEDEYCDWATEFLLVSMHGNLKPPVWSYIIFEWVSSLNVWHVNEFPNQLIYPGAEWISRTCIAWFSRKDARLSSCWRHGELASQSELTTRSLLIDTCYRSILLLRLFL